MKQFSLSGGKRDRRCQGDRFWITSDLSHGEGVRSGESGAICGDRNNTESECEALTSDPTPGSLRLTRDTILLLEFSGDKRRIMGTHLGDD